MAKSSFFTVFFQEIRVAMLTLRMNIHAALELRAAFGLQVLGMMINNCAFLVLWFTFFFVFGDVRGWQGLDTLALMGAGTVIFGVVAILSEGLPHLADLVQTGGFDSFLLKPRNPLVRLATHKISVSAVGDVLFGGACLVIYAVLGDVSPMGWVGFLLVLPAAMIVLLGFDIACQTAAFYFDDAANIAFSLYKTILSPSLYPAGLFTGGYKFFFTFIVPSLLIAGYPAEVLKSPDWKMIVLVWAVAIFWFLGSVSFFFFSLRRYESGNQVGG